LLLNGETLQQRLTRGFLDAASSIEIVMAITDALDAAHGKGIVHRGPVSWASLTNRRARQHLRYARMSGVRTAPRRSASDGQGTRTLDKS
jgi:hypothetical protein